MKTHCLYYVLIGIFANGMYLRAQVVPDRSVSFEHLTTNHGLPHNYVSNIVQDRLGFIWLSTKNGLCRYDGHTFLLFQNNNNPRRVISSDHITTLALDSSGNVWAATTLAGVNIINPLTGSTTIIKSGANPKTSLLTDKILDLCCAKNGVMWIGTWAGLSCYNPKTQELSHYQLPDTSQSSHIFTVYEDKAGIIWVATNKAVLQFYPTQQRWVVWNTLNVVYSFCEDENGNLWMGGSFGLGRYDPITGRYVSYNNQITTFFSLKNKAIITNLHIDAKGTLWVGTVNNGVLHFFPRTNEWKWYIYSQEFHNSLSHNNTRYIFSDRQGIVWIGTRGGGVNKYCPEQNIFTFYKFPARDIIYELNASLLPYRDSLLLISTRSGLFVLNKKKVEIQQFKEHHVNPHLLSQPALGVLSDTQQRLWVTTRNGALVIDSKNKTTQSFFTSDIHQNTPENSPHISFRQLFRWRVPTVPSPQISTVFQDKKGNFWFGTRGGGIYKTDASFSGISIFRQDKVNIETNSDLINTIFEDSDGIIWAGSDGGLLRFDSNHNQFFPFREPENRGLSSGKIHCLFEGKQKTLWIGTVNGLVVYHKLKNQWYSWYIKHGLSNNSINSIISEAPNSNILWIGTEHGLNRLMVHYPTDPTTSANIWIQNFTFGIHNGLTQGEFIPNAVCRDTNGMLYFAQYSGLLRVNPNLFEQNKNKVAPQMAFTAVKSMGYDKTNTIYIQGGNTFEFEEKENHISIEYIGLNYCFSNANLYSYILEGLQDEWSEPSTERKITFTNLHPGTYRFKVRASNNDGVWNSEGISLTIVVHPHWWKSWWAYILYTLVVTMGLLFVIRYRERIQQRALALEYKEREAALVLEKNMRLAEANEELLLLNTQLRDSNTELFKLSEEKTEILNVIAHDLKNPIIGIQKLAESIEHQTRKATYTFIGESSAIIHRTSERMLSMVQQLLKAHSAEYNTQNYPPTQLNLKELLESVLRDWTIRASQNGVRIFVQTDGAGDYVVFVNPFAMIQIFENLISNAVKFSPEDSDVIIHLKNNNKTVILSIQDHGFGMDKEQQAKVFQKFTVQEKTRKSDELSSGLGLYIVKKLTEIMNGRISFSSQLGIGTTFTIIFPCALNITQGDSTQNARVN